MTESSHHFDAQGYGLPRLELPRRRLRDLEMQEWIATGDYTERGNGNSEGASYLTEFHARAFIDVEDIYLEPGEGALLPVLWDRAMSSKLAYILSQMVHWQLRYLVW